MNDSVEEVQAMRLERLEIQAALHGPMTEPAILIEIAELKHRKRNSSSAERRAFVTALDFQFVMDVVAAALIRLGQVESSLAKNDRARYWRQLVHDVWMIAITVMMFLLLLLVVYKR